MRKLLKAMAAAVAISMLAAMETVAVQSPGGSIIEDGDDPAPPADPGTPPAEEIYDEVVIIGEDGVPLVRPDISPEMLELFKEYYNIDENGVPLAKLPETESSPKTGEDNTLMVVSGVGILSLAGAFVLIKKEKDINTKSTLT